MKTVINQRLFSITLFTLLYSIHLQAQNIPAALEIPLSSQKAQVSQKIGFTDVTVVYHSPSVRGRKIWGTNIAPYGGKPFLWRAGANENTTITFTDKVLIEGQSLNAGTYGLHMIPNEKEFTIIFSENSTSWGSFFYNESEDALRIKVTPMESPFREWLTYDFEIRERNFVSLALLWENLKIPMRIEVDDEVTLDHIRGQLRSSPAFTSDGWKNAASYCLRNNINHTEALGWIDRALRTDKSFANFTIKANLLEQDGKSEEGLEALKSGFVEATPDGLLNYVNGQYRLKAESKAKMATDYMQKNHSKLWQTQMALAAMYGYNKDSKKQLSHLEKALKSAPENRAGRISQQIERLKGGK